LNYFRGLFKEMPNGLYRSRLVEQADMKAGRFMSSLKDDIEILLEDIYGTEAHDIMLCEQGIISRDDLRQILTALEKIRREAEQGILKVEGEYEDVHEFLEDHVIKEAGVEAGGKLHTARSRNDQVALDIRLKTRAGLNEVSQKLIELVQTFLRKAEETLDIPIILYTHTQHAQIGCFAHYLLAQADILLRDLERLDSCYRRVNRSPLGACAIGGTRFPIDRYRTASLLGFDGLVENSIDAVSSRDFAIETLACLAILMINMSRIAEDLILWSTSEFGYVELADEFASTSSIMPQKKNPCTLELIRGKTGLVAASLSNLIISMKGLPTGYNRDFQEMKPPLWTVLRTVKDSLEILSGVVSTLKINRERWIEAIRNSYAVAVDLAEALTAKSLPFRQSHRVVGRLVREVINRQMRMSDIKSEMVAQIAEQVISQKVDLTENELLLILDPLLSLKARQSIGSPSPSEVVRMLQERRRNIEEYAGIVASRITRLEEAKDKLRRIVQEYIST
jgi:argininosuccinate lyase